MPIPSFSLDGVLPPYVGPDGPGGAAQDMSPYEASSFEVISTLGFSEGRERILRKWLRHRAELRSIGIVNGFQWLDGSFVEQKEPKDLDVVTFFYRPTNAQALAAFSALYFANLNLFDRPQVKQLFNLDFFAIDLDASVEGIVNSSRYYLGLFSHRRDDDLWKGMLQVRLENVADDAAAIQLLGPESLPAAEQEI